MHEQEQCKQPDRDPLQRANCRVSSSIVVKAVTLYCRGRPCSYHYAFYFLYAFLLLNLCASYRAIHNYYQYFLTALIMWYIFFGIYLHYILHLYLHIWDDCSIFINCIHSSYMFSNVKHTYANSFKYEHIYKYKYFFSAIYHNTEYLAAAATGTKNIKLFRYSSYLFVECNT